MKGKASQAAEERPSRPVEESAPASNFAEVARIITGDDNPPLWLVKHFKRWAPSLAIDRCIAVRQPTRSEMKKNLKVVQDAASIIIRALNDGPTREILDAASPGKIEYHGHIDLMLRDLDRRAKQAISSLSTSDGKTKPGRNKAMAAGASHPKTYCAAMIAEAWSFIHGVEPAPKNQKAAAAAEIFWRASMASLMNEATEKTLNSIADREQTVWADLNLWRHHFKLAKGSALSEKRAEFRRHLKVGKHHAEMLAGNK